MHPPKTRKARLRFSFFILFMFLISPTESSAQNPSRSVERQIGDFLSSFFALTPKENRYPVGVSISDIQEEYAERNWGMVHRADPRAIHLHRSLPPEILPLVLLHESIHLQQYRVKRADAEFVLEGTAYLGEYLFGKSHGLERTTLAHFASLMDQTFAHLPHSVTEYSDGQAHQGMAFLFFLFLYETFQNDSFTRAHFREPTNGLAGISTALRVSAASDMTPQDWKNPEVFVSQFYSSLLAGRNMLGTTRGDRFTRLMEFRRVSPQFTAVQHASFKDRMEPYSFRLWDLSNTRCLSREWKIDRDEKTLVYRATPTNDSATTTYEKTFVDSDTVSFAASESLLLFVIHPHSSEVPVTFRCVP